MIESVSSCTSGSYGSATCRQNVGQTERTLSAMAGGLLLVSGLKRGSILGSLALLVGGGLVYRALSGFCPVYDALGRSTHGGFDYSPTREAERRLDPLRGSREREPQARARTSPPEGF